MYKRSDLDDRLVVLIEIFKLKSGLTIEQLGKDCQFELINDNFDIRCNWKDDWLFDIIFSPYTVNFKLNKNQYGISSLEALDIH